MTPELYMRAGKIMCGGCIITMQQQQEQQQQLPLLIVASTSDNFKSVTDVFESSLAPLLSAGIAELRMNTIDMSGFKDFGFGTESWRHAIASKLRFASQSLDQRGDGEYVVISDTDIQFLQPMRLPALVEQAREQGLDYLGMREHKSDSFNGGFYVVRNSEKSRAFLAEVVERMLSTKNKYADQEILNELLASNKYGLKHDKVRGEHCVWGQGVTAVTKEAIFHHAVCTRGAQEKVVQMRQVRNAYSAVAAQKAPPQAAADRQRATRSARLDIVVAWFNEDIDWLRDVIRNLKQQRPNTAVRAFVYHKGPEAQTADALRKRLAHPEVFYAHLPNVGRESESYLRHAINMRDAYQNDEASGPAYVMFLQGHISDHAAARSKGSSPTKHVLDMFDDAVEHGGASSSTAKDHRFGRDSAHAAFAIREWKGQKVEPMKDDPAGTLGTWYERRFGEAFPLKGAGGLRWWAGATFCVSAAHVAKRPKAFYEGLLQDVSDHVNPLVGHFLERTWATVFRVFA